MEKKKAEWTCLNLLLNDKPQSAFGREIQNLLKGGIKESEKPDFLIDNIGVEHFLVDLLFTTKKKKAMSLERKNKSSIIDKVNYYNKNPDLLDKDIDNGLAAKFVEDIANSQINATSAFSFDSFILNYKRVFNSHYSNRNDYYNYCTKLGFLIEIPYGETHYIITNGNNCHAQAIKTMPVPKCILNYIWEHNDIDFVVLCIRPIYLNSKTKRKNISVIYIDPKNQKYYGDKIVLCDSFDFQYKFTNKDVVKLNVIP